MRVSVSWLSTGRGRTASARGFLRLPCRHPAAALTIDRHGLLAGGVAVENNGVHDLALAVVDRLRYVGGGSVRPAANFAALKASREEEGRGRARTWSAVMYGE